MNKHKNLLSEKIEKIDETNSAQMVSKVQKERMNTKLKNGFTVKKTFNNEFEITTLIKKY